MDSQQESYKFAGEYLQKWTPMKRNFLFILSLFSFVFCWAQEMTSIQKYGVLPSNTPERNRECLQKAIDEMAVCGGALYVTPCEKGYPVATGIVLKKNVSLIGAHGPTGRGTASVDRKHPVGSLFLITDTLHAFITVESATQIRGIQFWYPEQSNTDASKIIAYKPTIQMAQQTVEGVTLSCLTFYGEYMAMDFRARKDNICEQILFEHCYGYPLSGQFIAIDKCYDIPRVLHCHVNPANMREFGRTFSRDVIDSVVRQKTYTYWIDHTDNAQLMDLFTFGVFGGIYLGDETYGQLTNFNLDCVSIGIYKRGSNTKNRNWQISQGSIIANAGERVEDIHPILVDGTGHTALTNVESFSGDNGALTNKAKSYDYICVQGDCPLTVTIIGARMQGYAAADPITIKNPNAQVRVIGCLTEKEGFIQDR